MLYSVVDAYETVHCEVAEADKIVYHDGDDKTIYSKQLLWLLVIRMSIVEWLVYILWLIVMMLYIIHDDTPEIVSGFSVRVADVSPAASVTNYLLVFVAVFAFLCLVDGF